MHEHIRDLIAKGKVEEALSTMAETAWKEETAELKKRYQALKREKILGLVGHREYMEEITHISKEVLQALMS